MIGTYAALRVLEASAAQLYKHCEDCGISIKKSDLENRLHATLLYSYKPCPNIVPDAGAVHLAQFAGYELFKSEGENALVVLLRAPSIVKRHDALIKQGAVHSYPKFTPHVTLTYLFDGDTVTGLPPIDFPILLGNEYVEALKLDA